MENPTVSMPKPIGSTSTKKNQTSVTSLRSATLAAQSTSRCRQKPMKTWNGWDRTEDIWPGIISNIMYCIQYIYIYNTYNINMCIYIYTICIYIYMYEYLQYRASGIWTVRSQKPLASGSGLILLPSGPAVPRFPRHSDGVTHPRHQVFGATNVEAFHLSAFRAKKKNATWRIPWLIAFVTSL